MLSSIQPITSISCLYLLTSTLISEHREIKPLLTSNRFVSGTTLKNKQHLRGNVTCEVSETKKNKKFCEELVAYFPLIPHGLHIERRLQKFSIVVCVFVTAVFLSSCCLAMIIEMDIQTHELMEGIYEVRRWNGLIRESSEIHTLSFAELYPFERI
jgi:hypothetical protein